MHSRQQKKKTKQNEKFFCMKEYCLQTKNIPGRPYNLKTRKKETKRKNSRNEPRVININKVS